MLKIVAVLFVAVVAVTLAAPADEKYTVQYDNVNLKEILANKRLLKNYLDCLLDVGSCTPDGTELKKHLPEALKTDCAKCSQKQKEGSKEVLRHLYKNDKESFDKLQAKYDPDHVYLNKHKVELEAL